MLFRGFHADESLGKRVLKCFSLLFSELDESTVFVLGAVLYKNLELILPTLR